MKPRKLTMQKRETKMQRYITFVKRREGLFKKCAELAMLSDAQVAMFMNTPDSSKLKIHSFGHPSVDAVLDAFLGNSRVIEPADDDATKLQAISLSEEIRFLEREVSEILKAKMKPEKVAGRFTWDFSVFEKLKSTEEVSALVKILENCLIDARNRLARSASGSSSLNNENDNSRSVVTNKNDNSRSVVTNFDNDQFVYHASDMALLCLQSAVSDMENNQTAPVFDSGFGFNSDNPLSADNNSTGFNNGVHYADPLLESASYLDHGVLAGWINAQTTETDAFMDEKYVTPWTFPDSISGSAYNSNLLESKNKQAVSDPNTGPSYYYPGEDVIHEICNYQEDVLAMNTDINFGSSFLDMVMKHGSHVCETWNEDGIMNPEPLDWCYCSDSDIRTCYCCQARESNLFPYTEA
ncbi:hypothetical protein K2173_010855 [Erythroxylum novogranatense]|uniref:MADS-box domain-containing protein n=1 Tax=Erythroxylum novogranatense TaxID=1862640 RepID=A0AAV8T147_9ROSI|nr:hypothetical protein K2173_010855 [Erythroxylum novogranatense]